MRPFHAATALFAAALLAACGSSSPPPPSFSVARHLDSIAVSSATAHDLGRDAYMTFAIAVLGEGTSASTVSLSVNGATQSYQGVALEIVEQTGGPNPVPSDSLFVLSLWTSPDAASFLTVEAFAPDTIDNMADTEDSVTNANVVFSNTTPVVSVAPFTSKGHCHALTSIITASYLLNGTTCQSGTISGSFQFQVTAQSTAPANSFVLGNTTLPAVRIVLPAGDGGQQRLRGSLSRLIGH
ncbi:MAG TPA: hypothetical protein VFA43_13875 [Gemmatimonadaceae bacterium]|nr:hypothetical protein [Gemmatimonadaceae bacterium]